jgi:hypothetical protein
MKCKVAFSIRFSGKKKHPPASDWHELLTVKGDGWSSFRELAGRSNRYVEWGSGESTLFIDRQGVDAFRSVETDPKWAQQVLAAISNPNGEVVRVDLGPVERWGRPMGYSKADNFDDYFEAPFRGKFNPDLVLVDGRFRVACFLTAMLRCEPGTAVVFDDYVSRPYYHIVETVIQPKSVGNRQAVFMRPSDLDVLGVKELLSKFRFVMD